MYKIIFKGRDLEPLFIGEEKGKAVWDIWLSNKTTRVVVGDHAFSTGDIKSINKVEESKAEQNQQETMQQSREYDEYRAKMLDLPIEKRAAILRIPKIVWACNTKQEMTEETKKEIVDRQLAYFKENPKCIYANPTCYRDLIPTDPVFDNGHYVSAKDLVPISMLKIIQNQIQTDLQLSKSLI